MCAAIACSSPQMMAAVVDAGVASDAADEEEVCYRRWTTGCVGAETYWLDSCGTPEVKLDTCDSAELCSHGYCCEPPLEGGSFELPAHATYVHWAFDAAGYAELTYDLRIDSDPGSEVGMYYAHNGSVGDTHFYFGLQTTMHKPDFGRVGKGLIFSRWDTRDLADTRPAPGGFTQSSGHEGDFVGVRKEYPWTVGEYTVRLARADGDANGDWFELSITDRASGEETFLGGLRFPRAGSAPGLINAGGTLMHEVYSMPEDYEGDPDYALVPAWSVAAMVHGDGEKPRDARLDYPAYPHGQEYPNANGRYDRVEDRVTLEMGGMTKRCTPAGRLF